MQTNTSSNNISESSNYNHKARKVK